MGRPGLSAQAAIIVSSTIIREEDNPLCPAHESVHMLYSIQLMNRKGRGPFHANSTHSAPVEVEKDPALQAKQVAEEVAPAVKEKERTSG